MNRDFERTTTTTKSSSEPERRGRSADLRRSRAARRTETSSSWLTRLHGPALAAAILLSTMLTLAGPARAGELRIDYATGNDAPMIGYGKGAADHAMAPAIELVINRYAFVQIGTSPGAVRVRSVNEGGPILTPAEADRIRDHVEAATAEISGVPNARIRFEIKTAFVFSTQDLDDGTNVISLIEGFKQTVGNSGSGKSAIGLDASGDPAITEFDVRMDRNYTMTQNNNLLLHEILHGIGLNHSWLTRDCVVELGLGEVRPPSIMSYTGGWSGLSRDDEAAIARLYPRQWDRLSRTAGSVVGTLFDRNGDEEVYGAGVYLIDSSGRPVTNRISGFGHVAPKNLDTQTSGEFVLDGIAPGTYDLLVASRADEDVILVRDGSDDYERIVGPGIIYLERRSDGSTRRPNAGDDFDASARPRGWVRRIEVRVGEIVDLGSVRFGEDRDFLEPAGGTDRVEALWAGASRSRYWFDFWSGGRLVHRSGWGSSPRYAAQLASGRYAVRIYGWDGRQTRVLQGWTWVDYEPEETTVRWNRATKLEVTGVRSSGTPIKNHVEPLEYLIFSTAFGRPEVQRTAHGDHYTSAITPAYRFDGASAKSDTSRGLGALVLARQHSDQQWIFALPRVLQTQVPAGTR